MTVPNFICRADLNVEEIQGTFEKSGLGTKEVVVLLGALGELRRVVQESLELQASARSEDEDDDPLDPDFEQLVPTTFGSPDKKYGAKMGKASFGSSYLQKIIKKGGDSDNLSALLVNGPATAKELVKKYASTETAFIKDIQDVYAKLTLLGESYSTRNS